MSKGGRRATEALVDKEVVTLLRDSHARVTKLLTKHTGDLHTLSAEMLRRETLTGDEIRAVLGMEPVAKPTPTPKPTQKPNTSGGEKAESEKAESADGDVEKDAEKDGEEAIDMLLPEVVEPVEAVGDKSEAKESEVPTAA
jgi:ATP-dependent metalloprotease